MSLLISAILNTQLTLSNLKAIKLLRTNLSLKVSIEEYLSCLPKLGNLDTQ
ncbi:hypothetical protein S7335_1124 [Synechococcus sp. PCC 7335]|nr:hypothetical protein S7335_1124 [Synechococcus sp. PCC 7335]